METKIAILVDGGYFYKRLPSVRKDILDPLCLMYANRRLKKP